MAGNSAIGMPKNIAFMSTGRSDEVLARGRVAQPSRMVRSDGGSASGAGRRAHRVEDDSEAKLATSTP
jgi:hypothetical protein